ncbi:MAG TPA: ATP-dependent DNA helicase RecG [Ruminococcaceae bacterium]|nr:ATP-dependent DNA helicase RecG [Oscillospiraceae bacterium]
MSYLDRPLNALKGIGEQRAKLFKKLGVTDIYSLLTFFPRAYEDWSPVPIAEAPFDRPCCIKAEVICEVTAHYIREGMTLYKTVCSDGEGRLELTIFNNRYAAARLKPGREYLFYGSAGGGLLRREMASPEIRDPGGGALNPVYRSTAGLSTRIIENAVKVLLRSLPPGIPDCLSPEILKEHGLLRWYDAVKNIHFPADGEALENARKRLIFEELFVLQLGLLRRKSRNLAANAAPLQEDFTVGFASFLPFALTGAQTRAISDAVSDMRGKHPMNRLIQGDVGSGKTAVAAAAAYNVIKNGYQAVMMAPTEILAEQHYRSVSELFAETGVSVGLLTGSTSAREKKLIAGRLESGELDFIVGTHALTEDYVRFKRLGLAVTDEQHRFGVAQRALLYAKGENPHLMVMSATPIPRTLSLMIYGDLDVSLLDEMPAGRKKIETYAVGTKLRPRVYNYIKKHLDEGLQGYIVCPAVEEGDTGLVSAEEYYEKLRNGVFREYNLGLLHGRMKASRKDQVMRAFASGEIQLLIATTVIEVGIDVKNAVIIVIENAERFGLSQLHQLRGRVGRGEHASSCILISGAENESGRRLEVLCKTADGFKIAEEDLKLRGPGDFFGRRQHGLPQLKIADILQDTGLLSAAKDTAVRLLKNDPELSAPAHIPLALQTERLFSDIGEGSLN